MVLKFHLMFSVGGLIGWIIIAISIVMGLNLSVFSEAPLWSGFIIWIYIALLLLYIPIREVFKNK